jgi:hypothetical protein
MFPDQHDYQYRIGDLRPPTLPLLAMSDRQDLYSMGLVQSIVGAAGYNIKQDKLDRRKTDLEITLPDVADDLTAAVYEPKYSSLRVQVKCSYGATIAGDGSVHFELDPTTYRFLIDRRGEPRILVVVHVPRPAPDGGTVWITVEQGHTILRNRAYWLSLMGQPEQTNTSSITVRVPSTNLFDVSAVSTLMHHMAVQGDKNYAG